MLKNDKKSIKEIRGLLNNIFRAWRLRQKINSKSLEGLGSIIRIYAETELKE